MSKLILQKIMVIGTMRIKVYGNDVSRKLVVRTQRLDWESKGFPRDVEAEEPHVAIKGWNAVSELDMKEPLMTGAVGRQVYNYQLAVDELHGIDQLKQGKI